MEQENKIPVCGFEKWCLTGCGKKALSSKGITDEFLKNRLWWAYHAGLSASDIHYTNPIQEIFNELAKLPKNRLPVGLRKRIEYIIQNKSDYSIDKL